MQWGRIKMSIIPKDILERMKYQKIWTEECPVHYDRLRYLNLNYIDFDNKSCTNGQMIVLDVIADAITNIFKQLEEIKFPIEKIRTIEWYEGSDEKSMADNNSSAFNFRKIVGQKTYSLHSYGLAVDINPVQNPYLVIKNGRKIISPKNGKGFVNRQPVRFGMIDEEVVKIFKSNGIFGWGGNWEALKDWQHFEIPRKYAEEIIKLNYKEGKKYFSDLLHSF